MRKITAILFIIFFSGRLSAQLQSPDDFLGYKLGSRFTAHWQIVHYVNYVAQHSFKQVKLQQYGFTNEGRPLMVAVVSSPGNIQNLEKIRQNNLRLARQGSDNQAPDENSPAIVWLSYNVHGNEASCSEAALLTLFALADPANTKTAAWLKNTIIIIDPCLNPDGRDRYINWFASVSGKNYNPSMDAREHNEPWPGGRGNHYNFDLNRDWAWQTQVESQQRMALYATWLPQVHVDYHEQSVNEPYYFAPAAQPYHEVITAWQRDFQWAIGKKHAQYFDANGWLYFTKETFDLYYPSYGDTYPIYNGAIGMTYEQGGGPRGGLGALMNNGDTLTLKDRILHHYTTALSTIETASENSGKLVREFSKYFMDAVSTGAGEYGSFVIKNDPAHTDAMNTLLLLLNRNGIRYGTAKGAARGYNYDSGKEEPFTIGSDDIVISAFQPRASLVKVLFEPHPKLVDSLTYDITAWALPYAYGLNAYACKDKLPVTIKDSAIKMVVNVPAEKAFGYIIKWQSVKSAKILGRLMATGIKVRFTEEPLETGGATFDRGSLIILRTSNDAQPDLWNKVAGICNEENVIMYQVKTGFVDKGNDFGSNKVHSVKAPRVALLTGDDVAATSAGEIWHFFDRDLDYPVTLVHATNLGAINWNDINVLIMPEGDYPFLRSRESAEALKHWIGNGGKLIAMGPAAKQLAALDWGLDIKSGDDKKDYTIKAYPAGPLKKYSDIERDSMSGKTPGAIYRVDLDNSHPLAYGYPDHYYTLKMDDDVFEYLGKEGWTVGAIKKTSPVAGFIGAKLKERWKDGMLYGVLNIGDGEIIILGDDPLFRNFWENGKLLLCNALFLVGS